MRIEALRANDRDWIDPFITGRWGAKLVVVHGTVYHPAELAGFAAWEGEECCGLVNRVAGDGCELVTLDSLQPGLGIGTALIEAVLQVAQASGCRRLWLITTNDNLDALRFYQRRGFRLIAVYSGAVTSSRLIKPEIPLVGDYGIPIRDEIELEMALT